MKSKFLFLLVTLTLSFSVMALAQKKNDDKQRQSPQKPPIIQQLPGKVALSCSPGGGKDVSTPLYAKNPTAQDVPAGTIIYWSAKVGGGGTATNKEPTTQVLQKNSGNQISLLGPPGNLASCQAWYFKK